MSNASFINWITPRGLLLSALEGEHIDLQLKVESDGVVEFSVIDGIVPTTFFPSGKISGKLQSVNQSISFNFTVRAQSGEIFSDRLFAIFVTAVPSPPVWKNNQNLGNLFPNQPFYLAFDVVSDTNASISYNVNTPLPDGLFLSGNTIQGIISNTNTEGAGFFQVTATDGVFNSPITFQYNIIKTNFPPVWQTGSNLGTLSQGQFVETQLIATDVNNDPVVYQMPFGQGAVLQSAILSGQLLPPTVLNGGTGYQNSPLSIVTFYAGGGAEATANLNAGEVDSLTLINGGSNYARPPNIILTGGDGIGAEFEAITQGGQVVGFNKISGGSGYTIAPTVTFTTFLNPAVGTPNIISGQVVGIDLSSPGDAYLFPPVTRVESPAPPFGGGALPLGLRVTLDGKLIGTVSMQAEPKTYNFVVSASDGVNTPVNQTFSLTITPFSTANSSLGISWITSTGSLGDIFERYPSYFQVQAQTLSNDSIEYSLAPGSNPLPPGITLDLYSGALVGWMPAVSSNTTFSFTIRASLVSNPGIFSDRQFSIRVLDRFTTDSENYWYNFTGPQKIELLDDLFGAVSSNDIFNFFSPDFGVVKTPRLLISGGCVQKTDSETWNFMKRQDDEFGNPIPFSTYHLPLQLIFGNLRVVPIIPPGALLPITDAIVADIIDPNEVTREQTTFGAGGWTGTQNSGVLTFNPNIPVIYPNTLTNIRLSFQNQIGYAGNQYLPWHMLTTGYIPSIDLLYVNPGRGVAVLENLQNIWNSKYKGQNLILDRYYKTTQNNANIRIFNFDVDPR